MASVFVSYSHADREFVRKLAQDLTDYAVEVWLDEWQLAVGREIKAGLDEGIAGYDYFFIVLSKASVASDCVRHELIAAGKRKRRPNADRATRTIARTVAGLPPAPTPPSLAPSRSADLSVMNVAMQRRTRCRRSA